MNEELIKGMQIEADDADDGADDGYDDEHEFPAAEDSEAEEDGEMATGDGDAEAEDDAEALPEEGQEDAAEDDAPPDAPPENDEVSRLRALAEVQKQEIARLQQQQQQPAQPPFQDELPPEPTEDELIDTPGVAMEKIAARVLAKHQQDQMATMQAQQVAARQQYENRFRQSTATAVSLYPDLDKDGSPANREFLKKWHSRPELQKDPNGPAILAAEMLREKFAAEQRRQSAVKKGAMHGAGKQGGTVRMARKSAEAAAIKDMKAHGIRPTPQNLRVYMSQWQRGGK